MRLVALFLLAFSIAGAQTYDAASLLALHRAYVGWQFGDGTFTSMREFGSMVNTKPDPGSTPRPPSPMTEFIRGPVFRETQVDPETHRQYSWGFTGHVFWDSNDNGFTHPVAGHQEQYEISAQYLFNEATATLAGTLQPSVTIDDVSYPVVRVSPPAAFPIDVAVDPKTGAYVRAVIDPGGSDESTIDILAYAQPLPGKRVISSTRFHDSHYTETYTGFQANVPIADDELHPPPQTATWTFANPNPFPISTHGARIVVSATVNGVAGTFFLDTGASSFLFTTDFANRAHIRHAESSGISGFGGGANADEDIIDSLVIGGNTLSNVTAEASPLGNDYRGLFGGYEYQRIDGVLGYDLLAGAVVKLNFGANTMTILDPSTFDFSQAPGAIVTLDLSTGQPAVPMTLDDTVPVNAILDSGDPGMIAYSKTLLDRYHITVLRRSAFIGGVGGVELTQCGQFGKLQFGPIAFTDDIACQTDALTGTDIIVGYDFIKHFNIVFDYPIDKMAMQVLPQ